ncbi:tetratricopeptide repeat protein [Morganella psychrotolerans]|uniref:tetratricopeptide repeat protein n=1 Tax=Morganella psychrotolerans TaxID=368603 RepID=UPI0039AF372D
MKKLLMLFFLFSPAYAGSVDCKDKDIALCQKATNGDAIAQLKLGDLYVDAKLDYADKDYNKAKYWYDLSANQGNADAQLNLGILYTSGILGSVDNDQARKYWEMAAKQNNAVAQYNLGQLYFEGRGIKQDNALAKDFFEKSCKNGFPLGCDR